MIVSGVSEMEIQHIKKKHITDRIRESVGTKTGVTATNTGNRTGNTADTTQACDVR